MEASDQLPEGWEWRQIRDVILDAQAGFSSGQKDVPGGIPHLRMNNITSGCTLDLSELRTVPPELAKARHYLRPDDVLVCHTNSVKLVGKSALYDATGQERAFSNHLTRLRVKPDVIHPQWLWRGFTVLWRDRYFETRCKKWVNQATIERDVLLAAPIPLPPLPEQQRLVEKIARLLEQSRTAREALDRIPSLLTRFRQAVLAKAFRGELTERDPDDEPASVLLERISEERRRKWEEDLRAKGKDPRKVKYIEPEPPKTSGLPELPEGWVWATMGDVFKVSTGGTPARKRPELWNGQYPWVSSGEVAFRRISTTRESITGLGLSSSSAKLLPPGTVLLGMIGEGKTRGQAAILDIRAATNQNAASIVLEGTDVPPEYVYYWLTARYEETREAGKGGAQPALNGARVRQIELPIAPLPEQRRIVAKLEGLLGQADTIERAVTPVRRRVDAVDQAILARAFRGQL